MTGRATGPEDPRVTAGTASLRDLADLARAGSIILRQPLMQVTYEVHHVTDHPGYLSNYVMPQTQGTSAGEPKSFGETLTSSAHGLGLVVVTKTGVGTGSRRRHASVSQTPHEFTDGNGTRIFRGTARPNPSFLYQSAWRYEGLICIDPTAQRITLRHSVAIRDVIHRIARLASECRAPILSLQSPAQIPPRDDVIRRITPDREEEILPKASSLAVRFSMALHDPDATTILKMSDDLSDFCARRGYGFWLEDTRLGSRTGNWFEIFQPDDRMNRTHTDDSRESPVRNCMPVTLVGPARIGSTDALMSFLGQDIGITACSITSLDDLLFIHLELCFEDISSDQLLEASNLIDSRALRSGQPYDTLAPLMRALGYSGNIEDPKRTGSLMTNTGDYQCLIGPARAIATPDLRQRMAIWFSWQTQGINPDLSLPLDGLFGAFNDVGLLGQTGSDRAWTAHSPNIDYLVCRNIGNSIFRGKGKLSVFRELALNGYPKDGLESRPTNLCVAIEEAWRARIARDGQRGVRELTIGWRECWLGHWSLPL